MDGSSSSLPSAVFPNDFPEFSFFLVIKKIIIPELMGALLKFFEIDLCILQLAAIVNAVGHPSPLPFIGTPSFLLPPSILFFWCFRETFPLRAPHKTACCMQPPPHLIFLCGAVSKSAPENKFMIYRKHMLLPLFRWALLPLSVSLPLQEVGAYYTLSPVVVVLIVACCFLSASFVQFPIRRISLYSLPIIIAAITNNRSTSIGTPIGVWRGEIYIV